MAHSDFISPADLYAAMARDDAPRVLDVRIAGDVAQDPGRLPASVALPFDPVDPLVAIAGADGAPAVVVCQKGRKISQGLASAWRGTGGVARVLEGGWVAWAEAGLAMVNARPPGVWIAPFDPSPGQVAVAGAIWRWLDPKARILQVAPEEVAATSEVFGAPVLPDGPQALDAWMSPLPPMPEVVPGLHDLETAEGRAAVLAATRMEAGR